jgi:DNA-binding LacI/PurR family transcriptional regulator
MTELVRYVTARGHRKLAFIHGEMTTVTRGRLAGFYRVCEEQGITVPAGFVREGRFHDPEGCRKITREILELPERPSCIFFPDDYSYIGGFNAILEQGLSIPEDISVVGFGGYDVGAVVYPALTTVAFDYELMGMKAASYILNLLRGKGREETNLDMPLFFVERESVRDLNAAVDEPSLNAMPGMA